MQWLQYKDREKQLNSYISLTNSLFLKKIPTIFFPLYIRYAQRNDGLIVTYYKKVFLLSDFPTVCRECVSKHKESLPTGW